MNKLSVNQIRFLFLSGQEACYWGADISDSQLEGADVNIRSAGLMDKMELLKASVKGMSVGFPREIFLGFWDYTGTVDLLEVICHRANSQQIAE